MTPHEILNKVFPIDSEDQSLQQVFKPLQPAPGILQRQVIVTESGRGDMAQLPFIRQEDKLHITHEVKQLLLESSAKLLGRLIFRK